MKNCITYGIIPARSGSKGVQGKNIRLLNGYPLIAYSIIASKLCKNIFRTFVSTDSAEIADVARKYGAEVPFLRPAVLAGDESLDFEFIQHALDWFDKNENNIPDFLVHLRPTTPLRDSVVVDLAIQEIMDKTEATSLRSGHPVSESPFKWFLRDDRGCFTGILPEYSNERINAPRQSFPIVYIPDGYVDVLKTSFITTSHQLHGNNMIGFVSPDCVEVDSARDFEFLEYELKNKNNLVFEYLKANFPKEG